MMDRSSALPSTRADRLIGVEHSIANTSLVSISREEKYIAYSKSKQKHLSEMN